MNITKAFCLSMALLGAANIQAMENSNFIIRQDNTKVNNYRTNRPEAAKRLFVSQAVEQQIADVRAKKGFSTLRDMVLAGEHWEVK